MLQKLHEQARSSGALQHRKHAVEACPLQVLSPYPEVHHARAARVTLVADWKSKHRSRISATSFPDGDIRVVYTSSIPRAPELVSRWPGEPRVRLWPAHLVALVTLLSRPD